MPKYFYKVISIAIILVTFAILYSFVWRPYQKNRNFEKCLNDSKTNFENKTNEINSNISELENKKSEITPEIDEKIKKAIEEVENNSDLYLDENYDGYELFLDKKLGITPETRKNHKKEELRNTLRQPIEYIEKDIENLKKELENLKEVKKESDNECYKRF